MNNGENSNGILTQSQKTSEGRNINIDDLTVREAKELGYELLSPKESRYVDILSEFAHENIENTNFEDKNNPKEVDA
ncbi:hypothetical protein MBBAR_10c00820 [Methanobrevibacter arboriphilus JCM 13429 = DSM 1125]|uniref:Uncharacterized protein n=1 Tax=Methanobrevibacter arboriphilus JCM 13429 = DSM 1125 TaxID=1300164 RepID=A0A1V6N237_METAZ|nr:hypothetical protein [Methanobrevibacter arboriphilus]OQD58741.1 hypothetical protein MBBAR_10c00820 [Methanobrevibacter arboriphilus JCM 13429 = DSM 1125]